MNRYERIFERFVSVSLVAALLFMFSLIFLNVVLRFAFSSGVTFAEELARFAFIWTTFLGAYLAIREDQHISASGMRGMVRGRSRQLLLVCTALIQVAVLLFVLYGAIEVFVANLGGRAPVSGTPIAFAFAALVVGCVVMAAAFIGKAADAFAATDKADAK